MKQEQKEKTMAGGGEISSSGSWAARTRKCLEEQAQNKKEPGADWNPPIVSPLDTGKLSQELLCLGPLGSEHNGGDGHGHFLAPSNLHVLSQTRSESRISQRSNNTIATTGIVVAAPVQKRIQIPNHPRSPPPSPPTASPMERVDFQPRSKPHTTNHVKTNPEGKFRPRSRAETRLEAELDAISSDEEDLDDFADHNYNYGGLNADTDPDAAPSPPDILRYPNRIPDHSRTQKRTHAGARNYQRYRIRQSEPDDGLESIFQILRAGPDPGLDVGGDAGPGLGKRVWRRLIRR